MADIELVIKIPQETYAHLLNGGNIGASLMIENALKEGTPLPKGHGRLIDVDALIKQLEAMANNRWNIQVGASKGLEEAIDIVDDAPTIIEADKAEMEVEE